MVMGNRKKVKGSGIVVQGCTAYRIMPSAEIKGMDGR
jgi:hypothetical protein